MPTVGQSYPGGYREGESYLHQLDPRLKLLLLCLVMGGVFSADGGWRLLGYFGVWLLAAGFCRGGWRDGLRIAARLRWLLLFTLLLHLFFTPGRTLFGTSWLSYDGLLRGLLVDGQLLLAVLFSLLLAWTTRPERLAWGVASLLAPLQRFRLPVREAAGLLILVLQFFPIIQEEVARQQGAAQHPRGLAGLKARAALLGPLLLRLLDRADRLAVEIATGARREDEQAGGDRRLTRFDKVFFGVMVFFLALIWMV